jgi:cbb3-type cytochrome oxidase maturation protein
MSVLLILLFASLLIASAFLAAFIWSVRSGQYDDDYTPSVRMLFDEKRPGERNLNSNQTKQPDKVNGSAAKAGESRN